MSDENEAWASGAPFYSILFYAYENGIGLGRE